MRPYSTLRLPSAPKNLTAPHRVQFSHQKARGLLPFYLIDGIAICSDLILIISTSVLTGIVYYLAFLDGVGPIDRFLAVGALTGIIFSSILAARGAYHTQNLVSFGKQVWLATIVWLFVFFVLSVVAFSLKISGTYSRGATLMFFVLGWAAITIWRLFLARYLAHALAEGRFAEQKVVLLAEQGQLDGSSVFEELKSCGYISVRTFPIARTSTEQGNTSLELLESLDEITKASRQEQIECVFLLVRWDDQQAINHLIKQLRVLSAPVYLLPDSNVAHLLGSRIVNIGTTWTAELKRAPLSPIEQAFKRTLDLLIASTSLIMLAPMMLLIATAIKIDSRGPIFFMQTRNGFNGRSFRVCKFRTMSVLEDGAAVRQAIRNDPRVTRLGWLLRRTNIDELPQLFNVLAGDMSLVGPRPHPSALNTEYEKTVANYAYRYHVKPGLTGWAQIHGFRGETQTVDLMERRIEYDLWYINNWSQWLDFKILLRTLLIGLQSSAY